MFVLVLLASMLLVCSGFQTRPSFATVNLASKRGGTMVWLTMNNEERTYIMIKPDGVQRHLVGEIVERFESKGRHHLLVHPHRYGNFNRSNDTSFIHGYNHT
jgi:hypothetical protein